MTDTITEAETTAAPATAAAIVAAELDRLAADGANVVTPAAFRTGATPIAQALLDSVRGFGLRPKAEVAAQVHTALGLIAIAALTKPEEPLGRDFWWKDYPKDSLTGHLVDRLRERSDCSFSSPLLKAAFATAAEALTDEAFDAAPARVREEDRALLLAIGSHTDLADLTGSDATKGLSTKAVLTAVEAMVDGGVLYRHTYVGSPASWVPTPAGAVVLAQLQAEREARRQAEEAERQERLKALAAKRDAAVDALVPDFTAAHAALDTAFGDLNRAWTGLRVCDDADLTAAIEDFDRAQTAAGAASRTWTTLRDDLERYLHGKAYGWPEGGRDRLAAVLEAAGIDLGPNLTGPARRLPQALPALIAHQNEHLTELLAARTRPTDAVPADSEAADRAAAAERRERTWRFLALAAAVAALAAVGALILF